MSLKQMAQVWEHPNLHNHTDKLVLLCLANFANDEGECWPKMETVARKCSLTTEGVRGVVNRLEAARYLSTSRGGGRGRTSGFRLHVVKGGEVTMGAKPVKPQQHSPNTVGGIAENPNSIPPIPPVKPQQHSPNAVGPYKVNRQVFMNEPSEEEDRSAAREDFEGQKEGPKPAPPPPVEKAKNVSTLEPPADDEASRELLRVCKVPVHPRPKDLQAWPSALAEIRAPDATEHGSATAEDVREFARRFAQWKSQAPNPAPWLSQVSGHWRRLMAPRPKTEGSEENERINRVRQAGARAYNRSGRERLE